MAKLIYVCEYCNQIFSSRSEAVSHEQAHWRKCENPRCGVFFAAKREGQKYCSSTCNKREKQRRWRERQKVIE